MLALPDIQRAMTAALYLGPDHVPDALFAGRPARVLLGFKVHANTISHARLTALEDSFPHTRDAMGTAPFNTLCRDFLDSGGGRAEPLAHIGRNLPDWMVRSGCAAEQVDLARFEWNWLESFHAADASALSMADLAVMDETAVLALRVVRHPAVRVVAGDRWLCHRLGLEDAPHILLARPQVEVLVHRSTRVLADLVLLAAVPASLESVLTRIIGLHPHCDPTATLAMAINAGLLCPVETPSC